MTHPKTEGPVPPMHNNQNTPPPLASSRAVRILRSDRPRPSVTPTPTPTPTPASKTSPSPIPAPAVAHPDRYPANARSTRSQPPLDRGQILHATAHCLDQLGYEKTTIRTIAKRLDCAVGSIYRYFTDKTELLDAVVQHRFQPVAQAIQDGQPLDQTLRQYHATAAARPEQYRLMFWFAAVGRTPDQRAILPDVIAQILAGWAEQLDDANRARCQWAMLHGQLMLGQTLDCDHLPELPPAHLIATTPNDPFADTLANPTP